MQPEFKTTHNLDFEIASWLGTTLIDGISHGFQKFRVGTVNGLWRVTPDSYEILAIVNSNPNNGHLTDVFEWFESSAKRDNKTLKVLEIFNPQFLKHLLKKRGFKYIGNNNAEKVI